MEKQGRDRWLRFFSLSLQAVRANLERQNRELREKLEENEEFGKGKSRAMLGALEAKVHALEEQLDGEVR